MIGLDGVRDRIATAARAAGRDPADVELLLAVKTVTPDRIREAIAAGQTLLGHNRAQELTATEPELTDVPHRTHFIGHLQSNKVNHVLRWVECVQTVHAPALAQRLNRTVERQREAGERAEPLQVMIQVNTSGEESKAGVTPHEALDLAAEVAAHEHLHLVGFMTIGAHTPDAGAVRASYDALAQVRAQVLATGAPEVSDAVELSMGMSGDLEIAIAAGATMVRVGSAVFGARPVE